MKAIAVKATSMADMLLTQVIGLNTSHNLLPQNLSVHHPLTIIFHNNSYKNLVQIVNDISDEMNEMSAR